MQWFWSSPLSPPAKKNQPLFPLFPHLFAMKWWDWMSWSSFSECWVLSQLFHSLLFFIFNFYWNIVAVQCSVSLYCTAKWTGHTYTCISSLSLSPFTFKRFFSSSLSAVRVVSSAYLRLLIFLLTIFIPACVSCSLAFHMMYSAYKLNKQGDNI